MSRYVITELEGYPAVTGYGKTSAQPGLSVQVIDTAVNRHLVRTFRSEDYRGPLARRKDEARFRAAQLCAELNGEPAPSIPRESAYQPRCRSCGRLYDPDAYYCACGRKYNLAQYMSGPASRPKKVA